MQTRSVASVLAALMCCAAIAAAATMPDTKFPPPELDVVVPTAFGVWREVDQAGPIVPQTREGIFKIYDEMLTRTYVNPSGDRIMLSMAWGDDQRGERQAHRPEICYPSQGFTVETISDGILTTRYGEISVRRLTTSAGPRHEPVTYWLTMAGNVVGNQLDRRVVQMQLLRTRQIPDGLLFRVSSIDRDAAHAFAVQQQFAADLIAAMSPAVRSRVSGLKAAGAT